MGERTSNKLRKSTTGGCPGRGWVSALPAVALHRRDPPGRRNMQVCACSDLLMEHLWFLGGVPCACLSASIPSARQEDLHPNPLFRNLESIWFIARRLIQGHGLSQARTGHWIRLVRLLGLAQGPDCLRFVVASGGSGQGSLQHQHRQQNDSVQNFATYRVVLMDIGHTAAQLHNMSTSSSPDKTHGLIGNPRTPFRSNI